MQGWGEGEVMNLKREGLHHTATVDNNSAMFSRVKHTFTVHASNSPSRYLLRRNENRSPYAILYANTHGGFIQKSPKPETTQMANGERVNKLRRIHTMDQVSARKSTTHRHRRQCGGTWMVVMPAKKPATETT